MKVISHISLSIFLMLCLYGCKNITSLYDTDIIGGKKFCFYVDINDQFSKTLINNLKENIHYSENNCNYLALIFVDQNLIPINNLSGINQANAVDIKLTYHLFEYNGDKRQEIADILKRSSFQNNEYYIGRKHYYFTEIKDETSKIYHEHDDKEAIDIRKKTVNKLLQHLKIINTGHISGKISYMPNILLMTSNQQNRQDIQNQLGKNLSEKLINYIVLDIVDYQTNEAGKKDNKN